MKKTIKTVIVTLGVTLAAMNLYVAGVNVKHEEELNELKISYEAIIDKYDDKYEQLSYENEDYVTQLNELEEEVYKMFNDEAYCIVLHREDGTYGYEHTGKLFGSTSWTIK